MKHLVLLGATTLLFLSACTSSKIMTKAQTIIDQTQTEFIPDKRVKRWNIMAEQDQKKVVLSGETTEGAAKDALMTRLAAAKIKVIDNFEVVPNSSIGEQLFGLVHVSVCNIRSNPRHSGELATQATLGTVIKILKRNGQGWWLVQTPDQYIGWVDKDAITPITVMQQQAWLGADRLIVTAPFALAFDRPNEEGKPVTDLVAGNIVGRGQVYGDYYQISLPDLRKGYVAKKDVANYYAWHDGAMPTSEKIVATAKNMLGRPYLWGGTSEKGFDCSGFTKMVYFMNGVQLPRDASQQVHVGAMVETNATNWENLQAGDLLFFGTAATPERRERITHVAIWLGDCKIIHASGMVKIESLCSKDADFAASRAQTFIRARRPLAGIGSNGVQLCRSLKEFY